VARLIYSFLTSLDGYVADEGGRFDWAVPDAEVLDFITEREAPVRTYLYGRRLYLMMAPWETDPTLGERSPGDREFAEMWQRADNVVYSRTLDEVSTARTRLEREFDPADVGRLKAEAGSDLTVGGPTLAADALRAGLVDEIHQFLAPVVVGGGRTFFPDGLRLDLELLQERRFGNGMVFVRYRTR
jgi:dihydrofolate reductase